MLRNQSWIALYMQLSKQGYSKDPDATRLPGSYTNSTDGTKTGPRSLRKMARFTEYNEVSGIHTLHLHAPAGVTTAMALKFRPKILMLAGKS